MKRSILLTASFLLGACLSTLGQDTSAPTPHPAENNLENLYKRAKASQAKGDLTKALEFYGKSLKIRFNTRPGVSVYRAFLPQHCRSLLQNWRTRYGAVVLDKEGVFWVPLGSAESIDSLLDRSCGHAARLAGPFVPSFQGAAK